MVTFVTFLQRGNETAFRFLVTHEHATSTRACKGYLWVSKMHIAYEPVFSPEFSSHAFDVSRSSVGEAKYTRTMGYRRMTVHFGDRSMNFYPLYQGLGTQDIDRDKTAEPVFELFSHVVDQYDDVEKGIREKATGLLPELVRQGNKEAQLRVKEMYERGEGPFQTSTKEVRAGESSERLGQTRKAFDEYLAAVKDLPEWTPPEIEDALRERIIALALRLSPAPVIPEEARHHANFAATALEMAKTQPEQLHSVIREWNKALRLAPWWSEVYFNTGAYFWRSGSATATRNVT
jgi:hypothetical protein